jgi:hypothetical protein
MKLLEKQKVGRKKLQGVLMLLIYGEDTTY